MNKPERISTILERHYDAIEWRRSLRHLHTIR